MPTGWEKFHAADKLSCNKVELTDRFLNLPHQLLQTMRKFFLLLGLFPATLLLAQKKPSQKKIAETITETDLRTHLYIIAGEEMEGRETATEGQRKAAAYIENHFKSIGLLPGNNGSYLQSYPVYRDSLVSCSLKVNDQSFEPDRHFQPVLRGARSGTFYFSEVVFVGHGISEGQHDDYKGLDVKGKAVLMLEGAPKGFTSEKKGFQSPASMNNKYALATKMGAAAVMILGNDFPRKPMAALGNMYVNLFAPEHSPGFYSVSKEVASAILGSDWQSVSETAKSTAVAAKTYQANTLLDLRKDVLFLQSTNVMGYVEGSDKKDEWLIVTSHYDHLGKRDGVIWYGADDDGSGTVGVLEMAEAFAKAKAAGAGPRRSILFMTVSGEEKGLWGSRYYSEHPTVPIEKTTANLNIDMIGRVDTERLLADTLNYVYVVGDDKLSTELKPLSEGVNRKYAKMSLDYKFNDPNDRNRIYFRSDHYNFARKGVPVIFYYDGMLQADYHKPTDTPDKINYTLLKKRAQLIFHTAWEMANRDQMMKRDLEIPTMTR